MWKWVSIQRRTVSPGARRAGRAAGSSTIRDAAVDFGALHRGLNDRHLTRTTEEKRILPMDAVHVGDCGRGAAGITTVARFLGCAAISPPRRDWISRGRELAERARVAVLPCRQHPCDLLQGQIGIFSGRGGLQHGP